jgi:Dynein heavy chain, N-terminal region 2
MYFSKLTSVQQQTNTCQATSVLAPLQDFLKAFREIKNCVSACNQHGLYKKLEEQQTELEMCEKALADYKESKRRAFPRFYFVSSNDLLDILSNGTQHAWPALVPSFDVLSLEGTDLTAA